jgi:multidrug resistance protein
VTAASGGGPRHQFRRLAVLIAVNLVDMMGFMIVLPLLPFYALKLEASPEVIGWLIASYSIAQLLAAPIWGRVSDRYGRRPALLIGLSASAMAYIVFGLADDVWLLLLSRVVQGAGGGTTGVAQAYVADVVEPSDRARALGWLSAATSAGVMVGPALGSFAAHFGQAAPGLFAAMLCLINVFFAWRWLPESYRKVASANAAPSKPVWHPAWMALRHPGSAIGRLLWIYGVGMMAFASLTAVLALYLGAEFGIDEKTIGYVFLYVGILSFVMRSLLLGPIVDRIGETWAMRIGTILLVLGLALYPLPRDLLTLAMVIPLVPIGTALLFPATTSLMSRASEPGELGTTLGVAQTFAGLARVIAPILATITFQRLGHGWPFYVAGGLVALVGIMAFQVHVPRPGITDRAAEGAEA